MFAHRLDLDAELCLLEARHADALFALVDGNRAHLRAWLPWVDRTVTITDTATHLAGARKHWADGTGLEAGIWCEGHLAGVIGLHDIVARHRSGAIGYWLAEAWQGRGLMTAACRALITYAFRDLGLHRIEIRCAAGNARSRAIPERLGFTTEGTLAESFWHAGRVHDMVVYGMTAPRWGTSP